MSREILLQQKGQKTGKGGAMVEGRSRGAAKTMLKGTRDMSSTNKTANYQLNQWVGTDPVLMADFNADNAKIDQAIKSASDLLAAAPRIATGSYVGDGEYGSEHPNTLTFPFAPKLVIILSEDNNYFGTTGSDPNVYNSWMMAMPGVTKTLLGSYNSNAENVIQFQGSTMTWWCLEAAPHAQCNDEGVSYFYFAIG